jgi:hypothetical protein
MNSKECKVSPGAKAQILAALNVGAKAPTPVSISSDSLSTFIRSLLTSFVAGLGCGQGTEVVDGPIGKDGAAINVLGSDWAEDPRIVGTDAMVAHDEIAAGGQSGGTVVADVGVLRRDVRLGDFAAVDVNDAATNFDGFSGQSDDPLDERFGTIQGIPEDNYVATIDGLEAVDEFVDEDALLIGKEGGHAGAFDFYRLIEENDDDQGETDGDEEIAGPHANFVAEQVIWGSAGCIGGRVGGGFGGQWRCCGGDCVAMERGTVVLVVEHLVLTFSYNTRAGF